MKKLRLSGKYGIGKFALVDNEFYSQLLKHTWRVSKQGYVVSEQRVAGKKISLRLHRFIMNNALKTQDIDHSNHNKLDNRKVNLRICTRSQNQANRLKQQGTTSKYKGVSWHKRAKKWVARIKKHGVLIYLGSFNSEKAASKEYNKFAKLLFQEFAHTNN